MRNFLFLLVVILVSCKEHDLPETLDYRLDSKNFCTRDTLGVYNKSFQVVGDSLLLYDKFHHALIFLDLKKDIIHTMPLEFNGPNGFDSPIGFVFLKNDGFFLADDFSMAAFNDTGKKLLEENFLSDGLFVDLDALYNNPGYAGYRNHLIYDPISESVLLYFQKESKAIGKRIFAQLNVQNSSISSIDLDYPAIYENIELTGQNFQLSTTQSQERAYFIFSGSSEIKYFDFQEKQVVTRTVPSFLGKQNSDPPLDYDVSDEEYNSYLNGNPFYTQIHFDQHQNLLYRVSIPVVSGSKSQELDFFAKRKLFITVLDVDLNVLGQIELEEGRYNGNFVFAYSEGIWVSLANPLQQDEKLVQGDLVKIKGVHY